MPRAKSALDLLPGNSRGRVPLQIRISRRADGTIKRTIDKHRVIAKSDFEYFE